jgi:tetratricopeptide (TPR) repeat protein
MCLARWFMRRAIPFEEWYRSLFPDNNRDSGEDAGVRLAAADSATAGSLTPFAEVLAFGSAHQKQALISLINQHFRPAFGPILKLALNDSAHAVRVQAATAMNKLETVMLERRLELSRRAKENPGDVLALAALARHYDDYLYSGILDARREEEVRARALEAYKQCVAAEPGDLNYRLAEGRLLLRARRYAEAADSLETAIAGGLSTPRAGLWYMEALYHLGRFDQLRSFARSHPTDGRSTSDLPPAAAEVIELWSALESARQGEAVA